MICDLVLWRLKEEAGGRTKLENQWIGVGILDC
jgi:hypothetical protein